MGAFLSLLAAFGHITQPWGPRPLPTNPPVAILDAGDCAAAQRNADVIAQTLGFVQAHVTCSYFAEAPLRGKASPRMPVVRNLVGYSVVDSQAFQLYGNTLTYSIPSSIPWASAQATVVAYLKIDAMLMDVPADDLVGTAFALENAGVSRSDISKEPFADQRLFVRVRPMTIARALKIAQAAKKASLSQDFHYRVTGFIRDCDGTVASMTGLALAEARTRAGVMARAAHTGLGEPLAVIDRGGGALNAVCGLGGDATVHQLALAARNAAEFKPGTGAMKLDAAVVRTMSAAWRLNLPANPPGASWREIPRSEWQSFGEWVTFLADGKRSVGVSGFPKGVAANRVRLSIPDWAEAPLRTSPYAADLTFISYQLSPFSPALLIRASSPPQLAARIAGVRNYISQLPQRSGRSVNLGIVYGRGDCRAYVYEALYGATRNAIANLHGSAIRYLQDSIVRTGGPVSCASEPTNDDWTGSEAGPFGDVIASVAVGY